MAGKKGSNCSSRWSAETNEPSAEPERAADRQEAGAFWSPAFGRQPLSANVRRIRAVFAKLRDRFTKKLPNRRRQTRFTFDGQTITADGPLARWVSVRAEDIREIGVETIDAGPFIEDVFWLVNRDTDGLRIPRKSSVFKTLMDYFGSFEGYDWQPFTEAMACTDCRYFLCWRQPHESA